MRSLDAQGVCAEALSRSWQGQPSVGTRCMLKDPSGRQLDAASELALRVAEASLQVPEVTRGTRCDLSRLDDA